MKCFTAGSCVFCLLGLLTAAAAEPPDAGKFVALEIVVADVADNATATPTAASVLELEKAGRLSGLSRYRLSGLENQQLSIQFGERVAVPSARNVLPGGARGRGGEFGPDFGGRGEGAGGFAQTSYTQVSVGTLITAVSRVEGDSSVVTDLKIERSGVTPPRPADAGGFAPQGTTTLSVQATVRSKPGEPLLVTGRQQGSGNDATQTWVVLTSTVAAAPAAAAQRAAAGGQRELRTYQLKYAPANETARLVAEIMSSQPVNFLMTPNARLNALHVQAPAAQHKALEALLDVLDVEKPAK